MIKKGETIIKVENVSKTFKVYYDKGYSLKEKLLFWKRNRHEVRSVLNNISFNIKKGESVGLIGRNGCGKSTMLKMLTRIYYPNKGKITVKGRVSSLIELGAGFHPDMSGRENIYINASIFGLSRKEIDKRVESIIDFSEIRDFIDNPVRTYSSGMYMRLAFAVAISVDADILLIDEILAVGDANFQAKCFNKLKELKKSGITIVLVTHSMQSILDFCDRCIWIEKGSVKGDGKTIPITNKYITYMSDEAILKSLDAADRASIKYETTRRELEEKRKKGLDSSQDHYGIGGTVFKDVYILNKNKEKTQKVHTDDLIDVVMEYENKEEAKELMFVIGFVTLDKKTVVYSTSTNLKKDFVAKHKTGKVKFHAESLPLQKGTYYLSVAIYSADRAIPLDIYKYYTKLDIISKDESSGYISIDHSWSTK